MLLEKFQQHKDQLPNDLLQLLSHTANTHKMWNDRISGNTDIVLDQSYSFEQLSFLNDQNFKRTQEIIERYPLSRRFPYHNSEGICLRNSLEEILFHVTNHYSHHRGQMVDGLRKHGISSAPTDYISYKHKTLQNQ